MSESMHVSAMRDMDATFKRLLAVKKFCDAQGVSYPKEVTDFFGGHVSAEDDEDDLRDEMCEIDLDDKLTEWSDGPRGYRGGYEIDVADIPADAKTLRFYIAC